MQVATQVAAPPPPDKPQEAGHRWVQIENKPLLTLNEAAQVLNITPVTLQRWLKAGIIKSSRLGKKHLFDRKMLDKKYQINTCITTHFSL